MPQNAALPRQTRLVIEVLDSQEDDSLSRGIRTPEHRSEAADGAIHSYSVPIQSYPIG
jgi:hypothetical protein